MRGRKSCQRRSWSRAGVESGRAAIYINIDLEAVVMWAMPQIPAGGACFQTLRPVLGDTTKQMFSK